MSIEELAMLMKSFFLSCLIVAIFSGQAKALGEDIDGYLCIPEQSTGFSYKEGKWSPANFDISNIKYFLTSNQGGWLWKKMGDPTQDKFPQSCVVHNNGFMDCEFSYKQVRFNSQTLRFQIYTDGTYVHHEAMRKELEQGKHNDIFIEIGRCSPL